MIIPSHAWVTIAPGVQVWHNEGRAKYLGDGWFRIRQTDEQPEDYMTNQREHTNDDSSLAHIDRLFVTTYNKEEE